MRWLIYKILYGILLLGFDTLGRFSAIFYKGDNFCDFMFDNLCNSPLLKKGVL